MTLTDAQYEWNPIGWPPRGTTNPGDCLVYSRAEHLDALHAGQRRHPQHVMSGGACNFGREHWTEWQRLAHLLVDFHAMVVRDGLHPPVVHREFLKIDEYRTFIAPDCDGAEVER